MPRKEFDDVDDEIDLNNSRVTLIKLCVLMQKLTEKVEENSESVKEVIGEIKQTLNHIQEGHVLPMALRLADKESRIIRLEKIVYGIISAIVVAVVGGVASLVKWKA